MVQSIFPGKQFRVSERPKDKRQLGLELALPLTLLVFIILSEQSPLLKMQVELIVDWLCEHDYVVTILSMFIASIPIWMIAVNILEEKKSKK